MCMQNSELETNNAPRFRVETSKHVTSSCHCTNLGEFVDDSNRWTTKKAAPALGHRPDDDARAEKYLAAKGQSTYMELVVKATNKETIKRFCRTNFTFSLLSKSCQGLQHFFPQWGKIHTCHEHL